jgi:hypothetical protein
VTAASPGGPLANTTNREHRDGWHPAAKSAAESAGESAPPGGAPGTRSGGRLIAGITEVSAPLACVAAWRRWCCSSALAVAAASRSLITRIRRARARARSTRSTA